jgi:hypothetical protein
MIAKILIGRTNERTDNGMINGKIQDKQWSTKHYSDHDPESYLLFLRLL